MRMTWDGTAVAAMLTARLAALSLVLGLSLSLPAAAQAPARDSALRGSGRNSSSTADRASSSRSRPSNPFLAAAPSLGPLLRTVSPAVVDVVAEVAATPSTEPREGDEGLLHGRDAMRAQFHLERRARAAAEPDVEEYTASGIIVDAGRGLVATNASVVRGATSVAVELVDRRRFAARVVGSDEGTDIAVLEIQARGLTAVVYGDSSKVEVGDFVVQVGNVLDLGQSATLGMVSGLKRRLGSEGYDELIETDVAMSGGSAGGALIDLDGRLLGMSIAVATPFGGDAGLSFAIPVRIVKSVVRQIVKHGNVRRGSVGLHAIDVTPDLAATLSLSTDRGALVTEVDAGSTAEAAGIRPGDVITSADGNPVATAADARVSVAGLHRIGEVAALTVLRAGKTLTKEVQVSGTETCLGAVPAAALPKE